MLHLVCRAPPTNYAKHVYPTHIMYTSEKAQTCKCYNHTYWYKKKWVWLSQLYVLSLLYIMCVECAYLGLFVDIVCMELCTLETKSSMKSMEGLPLIYYVYTHIYRKQVQQRIYLDKMSESHLMYV